MPTVTKACHLKSLNICLFWENRIYLKYPCIRLVAQMKIRHHKGTLSFLGSRHLNNTGRRLNYLQLELFRPHTQIRRLQNPQMTM